MEDEHRRIELDREALGEAIAEVEAELVLIDSMPRRPHEDPFAFVLALREAGADRDR
jgi:hypothetical protein